MSWAAVAIGGGSVISSVMQGNAAGRASDQQVAGSERARQYQDAVYNQIRDDNRPYRETGWNALADLSAGFGLKPPTQPNPGVASGNIAQGQFSHVFDQNDFYNNSPGYQFRLGQGQMAASNSLNKMGGMGGNFSKGLQDYTQGFASNEWDRALNQYTGQQQNIFNRLSNIAGMGQQANATVAGVAIPTSQGVANAMTRSGDAQAAGTMGQANAYGNAISTAGSWYGMSKMGGGGGGYKTGGYGGSQWSDGQ